nr:hypothetical protein [uncultured Achromobacter sp.]
MIEHRKGISIAVLLIVAPPLVTLIATAHQMIGTGGDGLIRARAVTASAPPATQAPAGAPATSGAPGATPGATPGTAPGTAPLLNTSQSPRDPR